MINAKEGKSKEQRKLWPARLRTEGQLPQDIVTGEGGTTEGQVAYRWALLCCGVDICSVPGPKLEPRRSSISPQDQGAMRRARRN